MRALSVCISFALATVAAACGDDAPSDSAAHAGIGGVGAAGGGVSGSGSGGTGKSGGGTSNAGVSGTSATGGAAGSAIGGTLSASAGASAGGDTSAAGSDAAAGAATGGAASGAGGDASMAGGASGGDGSAGAAGSPGNCAVVDPDKLIFVSSALYTGSLGGLSGADSKCQGLADAAGLCGTFKAWLSDGTANAADRLTHATGNYVLTTGEVVASGWDGLISGTLQHAINVTEGKAAAPVGTVKCAGSPVAPVWTGATNSGIAVPNGSCSNWGSTSTGPGAAFGSAIATNFAWSGMCQIVTVCPNTAALYCLQQ